MSSLCCKLDGQETASRSWLRSPCASPPWGVTLVCRGGRKKQEHPQNRRERNNRVHIMPTWDMERRQKLNCIRKYQTSPPMLREMQATRATCLPVPECALLMWCAHVQTWDRNKNNSLWPPSAHCWSQCCAVTDTRGLLKPPHTPECDPPSPKITLLPYCAPKQTNNVRIFTLQYLRVK